MTKDPWIGEPASRGASGAPSAGGLRERWLVTVGVLHLITVLYLMVALFIVGLVEDSEAFLWLPVVALFAAVPVVVGVGCIRKRHWGWVGSIGVSSVPLYPMLRDITLDDVGVGVVVSVVWLGAILGISVAVGARHLRSCPRCRGVAGLGSGE